jgi:hypothetical protein
MIISKNNRRLALKSSLFNLNDWTDNYPLMTFQMFLYLGLLLLDSNFHGRNRHFLRTGLIFKNVGNVPECTVSSNYSVPLSKTCLKRIMCWFFFQFDPFIWSWFEFILDYLFRLTWYEILVILKKRFNTRLMINLTK